MLTMQRQPDDTPSESAIAFRNRHRSLVWSNPNASDALFIRHALLQPRFTVLLDAAVAFGMDVLYAEWNSLLADDGEEVRRATPVTQRMLKNIQDGYEQTTS